MEIDKKRVVQSGACIATLVAFAMSIPQAVDSHQRQKEEQALQLEERTLQFSTPATTNEQKAILRAILPKYGFDFAPANPHEKNSLLLLEETPSCIYGSVKLKAELKLRDIDIDDSQCQRGLLLFLQYNADNKVYSGLGLDLLKVNRLPWINPDPEMKGIVLLSNIELKKHPIFKDCEISSTCWEYAYINVSRAVISNDKKAALITVEYSSYLFGHMESIRLKKIDGLWVSFERRRIYIS